MGGDDRRIRVRRLLFTAAILGLSLILSSPAALYLWKKPDVVNVLSLSVSVGFFASILLFVRRTSFQILLGLPVLALNLIEIIHLLIFGSLISLGGIEAIIYVDPNDAREFAGVHASYLLLGALVIALFCTLAYARSRFDDLSFPVRALSAFTALAVPFGLLTFNLAAFGSKNEVYLPTRILEHYTAYVGLNPLTQTISGIATTLGSRADWQGESAERQNFRFGARRAAPPPAQELYIVVVGESSRRHNWALNGYRRDTNPNLTGLSGLFSFTDSISPATTTNRSLPLSFSFATPGNRDLFYRTRSFVSAFREAGFKTFWISNQGTHRSAVGNEISLLMGEADETRSTNFGFWHTVLDEELLPELDDVLTDPAPRKLVILHTLGSHTNYRQRYPAEWITREFAVPVAAAHTFLNVSAGEAATIDDYDKTIAYTDWFVSQVIRRHRDRGLVGAVVYFSDHGQRLYDDASRHKGHGYRGFKDFDVAIPLLVWLPDAAEPESRGRRSAIAANAGKPVSTVDLATSLLELAGITVPGMDPSRSFFSSRFVPRDRMLANTDGAIINYDSVILADQPGTDLVR